MPTPKFGQLVIGPPGSGKSTYCDGMQQILRAMGRPVAVVNLDPANDNIAYDCAVDMKELITVEEVMDTHHLGPNGSLIYCLEYLLKNSDWLCEKILALGKESYIIVDCPGQVELFTHNDTLRLLVRVMEQSLDIRFTAVHLVDSTFCVDPHKYISALFLSMSTQAQLELPHVNVLSKIDLLRPLAKDLAFRIDYFADPQHLTHLLRSIADNPEHPFDIRFRVFNKELCDLIEDFNMVSFQLLDIQNRDQILRLLKIIDTANGCSIGKYNIFNMAADASMGTHEEMFGDAQEKYIDGFSDSASATEEELLEEEQMYKMDALYNPGL